MNIAAILQQLIAIAKMDAAKTALPAIAAFFNSIASNPTAINVTVQLAELQVALIASLPTIEQDILKQIASVISTEAQTIATAATLAAPHA
jgi:hypothetical protein